MSCTVIPLGSGCVWSYIAPGHPTRCQCQRIRIHKYIRTRGLCRHQTHVRTVSLQSYTVSPRTGQWFCNPGFLCKNCKIGEISSRKTKHCLHGMDTTEDPPLLDKVRNIFLAYFSGRFVVCSTPLRLQPIRNQLRPHSNMMFGNPFSSDRTL